ncbi:type II secretion system F family protein [Stratiformator vulcanicus]|uniref:Type II secretion system protein F n=1 Tax=Stratiformator vulcanicus TaxID=2527980 RepID=A0A517R1S9_9PLAN|nr:type II secretion system F family protein [Stratiformator vulcanicus]QDT37836.1 Type II secretion system protein F [Stratiformator vulcanicus]
MLGDGGRIPQKALSQYCRSLGTLLHSGVDIRKAFVIAGDKAKDPRVRRRSAEIAVLLRRGEDVTEAMGHCDPAFPPLMIDMVNVAEKTGTLPEVLHSLSEHFDNNVRLRKSFIGAIAFPVFQLVAAIGIIGLLIFVLGIIGSVTGNETADVLGWGLVGTRGALIWYGSTFGLALGLFVLFKVVRATFSGMQMIDVALLRVPVLGKCLRSFAIARFSWAFALTQQAGMRIDHSLEAAFRATSNGAYIGRGNYVYTAVESGVDLAPALEATRLFPADYLHLVEVGDHSGTVPETLERLSPELEAEARRSMSALVAALAWVIWALVAGFIIFVIFSIFSFYLSKLQEAAAGF